jgi:methionyl-tRNA synthetase
MKVFLTSTLPYINSVPHIGHALEFILSDAISRYLSIDNDVIFNTGLDEHGSKVYNKSVELGVTPQEYVDIYSHKWLEFTEKFNIKYTNFYRTTDKNHKENVSKIWKICMDNGDIYKKKYKGLYCIGCESFKLDKDLIDGKCPDHNTTPVITEEENYFFRISKYTDNLLTWLDNSPSYIQPSKKIEELKNIVKDSEDLSISRLKSVVPWGIDVPDDETQTIYIWWEALLNYILSCGYIPNGDNKEFTERWSQSIQLCGPDNIRFQGGILQSMLESLGIKHTNKLLVHGMVLDQFGKKMSKTVGNVVDPIDQFEKFGLDAVRYYALAGLNTYSDSSWSESDLIDLYNSELANDYGNLITRVLHLIDLKSVVVGDEPDNTFKDNTRLDIVINHFENYQIKDALKSLNDIVKFGNKYITDSKPWDVTINPTPILNNLYWLLGKVNDLYSVVIPNKSQEVNIALKSKKKVIIFNKIEKIKQNDLFT